MTESFPTVSAETRMAKPKVEAAGIEPASHSLPILAQKHKGRPTRYVYFVGGAGLVKIGIAGNPEKRLFEHQVGSPVHLELLGFHPGSTTLERALHIRYEDFREHGEWFRLDAPGLDSEIEIARRHMEVFGVSFCPWDYENSCRSRWALERAA